MYVDLHTSEDGHSSKYSANLFVCEKNTLWANQFLTFLLDLKWQFNASYQSLAAPLQRRRLILLSLLEEDFYKPQTWSHNYGLYNIPNLCNVPKTPVENGPIDHISQRGIFTLLSTYSAGVLPLTSVPSWCGILHWTET